MGAGDRVDGRDAVHEVKFTLHDPSHVFVGISGTEDCRLELAEMIPRGDERYGQFFTVTEADPERVTERAAGYDAVDVHLHDERADGGLVEFVSGHCPASRLAELGGLPRQVLGSYGRGQVIVEIPPQYETTPVIEGFLDAYPESELVAKREKDTLQPMLVDSALQQAAERQLTDRQREVLRTALEAGYYGWPRESTGKEVADELGITSSTFSQHIQAAERNLLSLFFDDTF